MCSDTAVGYCGLSSSRSEDFNVTLGSRWCFNLFSHKPLAPWLSCSFWTWVTMPWRSCALRSAAWGPCGTFAWPTTSSSICLQVSAVSEGSQHWHSLQLHLPGDLLWVSWVLHPALAGLAVCVAPSVLCVLAESWKMLLKWEKCIYLTAFAIVSRKYWASLRRHKMPVTTVIMIKWCFSQFSTI